MTTPSSSNGAGGTNGTAAAPFRVGPVLASAVSTMATILLTALVGVRFATHPSPRSRDGALLDPRTMKKLARASVTCFLPAIIFTNLAKNMDAGALSELWILPAVAVLHNIIGVAVGRALLCLFDASCLPKAWRIPHFFRNPFLVGTMFGNSSQLPLVVGYALCAQRPLSLLGFELAWRRYLAGNFIYLIGWNLLFWSVGNAILSSFADDDEVGGDDMTSTSRDVELVVAEGKVGHDVVPLTTTTPTKTTTMKSTTTITTTTRGAAACAAAKKLLNMPNFATIMGIGIGLIPGARQVIFEEGGELQFVGSAIELLAQPAVAMATIIVAGSLGRQAWVIANNRRERLAEQDRNKLAELAEPKASSGSAAPMGAALGWRPALLFAVSRVIVVGSLNFVATAIVLRSSDVGRAIGAPEKILLLVECFTPSANLVVVVSQQVGNSKGAAALSMGYLIQYGLFFPMLLLGSTLSVWIIS
jgi:hypothetical protein